MNYKLPKRIAMINDIAGFGRCSTTVALPIISAMKVQVCPVPTSIFSNHTGFSTYHFTDYTEHMPGYLDAWDQLELTFDGLLCGFLGSVNQIKIVRHFINKHTFPHIIIDPVMGDHGKAYRTITKEHCEEMKRLITHATIITPNITEACLLTNTPYQESTWTKSAISSILKQLSDMGPEKVVITGIQEDGYFMNYLSTGSKEITQNVVRTEIAGESRPGTGDIFASIIAADAVNEVDFLSSVRKAAEFVKLCTNASSQIGIPTAEGVCFENFLDFFWNNNGSYDISD